MKIMENLMKEIRHFFLEFKGKLNKRNLILIIIILIFHNVFYLDY